MKSDEKHAVFIELSKLLYTSLDLLKGNQSLHFTSLSAINRILDMCIVHKNYEIGSLTKSTECVASDSDCRISAPKPCKPESVAVIPDGLPGDGMKAGIQKKISSGHDPPFEKTSEEDESKSFTVTRTPLEILTALDPAQVMSVLHNSITMHKRIIGTRQKCTPSTRLRQCTHHCIQILSARILVVMCHGPNVQHKVVADGHVRTLVEALDPNNSPVSRYLIFYACRLVGW